MFTPLFLALLGQAQPRAHVETSIVIDLEAPPAVVLPLFGPIREAEWAHGWNPTMLYPADGRQISGSVFKTGHDHEVTWILTRFDDSALEVAYAQVLPAAWAGEVLIRLKPTAHGRKQATVTYRRTALAPDADRRVEEFGREFAQQRDHWQDAINHRLRAIAGHHD